MPFLLYEKTGTSYQRVRHIQLAGKHGPLYSAIAQTPPENGWHLSEREILERSRVSPPDNFQFIVDLKPSAKAEVSFYRLKDVWGFRHESWCPLALRLETMFVDYPVDKVEEFKQSFEEPTQKGDDVYEFLYVGDNGGRWTWGRTGRVNGPLLWPPAFDFFVTVLSEQQGWSLSKGGQS